GAFQDASATYYWQTVFLGFHHNESSSLSPSLYKGCTAKGKYAAVIHLTRRSSSFLPALVISSFAIQSPAALKKYGADQGELRNGTFYPTGTYAFSHPTGTGPFKFKSWTVGQKVELVRNNAYWGKKPKIGRVTVRPIPNNTARVQALQTGEINGADPTKPKALPRQAGRTLRVPLHLWCPTGGSRPDMPNAPLALRARPPSHKKPARKVPPPSAPWRPDYVRHVDDGTALDSNLVRWT